MRIENKEKLELKQFLKNSYNELRVIQLANKVKLSPNEYSSFLDKINAIYQDSLARLKILEGHKYNKLKNFYTPTSILNSQFVNNRINSLVSLLNSFALELNFDLQKDSKSKLKFVYDFIISTRLRIAGFATTIIFILSSLISIFSFDIRERLLCLLKSIF